MSWYIPYHKLDSEQSQMIDDMVNDLGHVHWVKGFAGTGKSTVLLNFAQQLQGLHQDKCFCFITYTNALVELLRVSVKAHQLKNIAVMTHTQFLKNPYRYHFVFLDEVQDISGQDLQGIRQKADWLFVAGDCEQNIYEQGVGEGQIKNLFHPKEHELTFMHRLTSVVAKVAFSILPLSRLTLGKKANTNADTTTKLIKFSHSLEEYEWLAKESLQRTRALKPCVILFSFHNDIARFYGYLARKHGLTLTTDPKTNRLDYQDLNNQCQQKGLNFCYLGNHIGSLEWSETKPIVYIMTIHSSKGLDFQSVFIPHLNSERTFHWQQAEELEKRMLFVAITRTRQDLFLTYTSAQAHHFLKDIPQEYMIRHNQLSTDDEDEEEDFF